MDGLLPEWAAQLLHNHETLRTYGPWAQQGYIMISRLRSYIFLLIDQVSKKPDLATIALLLIILFVSLKILNMLYQTLVFWLRLAFRVAFWGGLVALAVWMYSRGPEGVWEDMGYWAQVWGQEHEYWRERERVARMARQGKLNFGGGGRGGGWF